MAIELDYTQTLRFLSTHEDFYILCHQSPDGDTLGSGFALMQFLRNRGKRANVLCADPFPQRYAFLSKAYEPQVFACKTIIAVDVADAALLGKGLEEYKDKVELCIDHHISNTGFAQNILLNPKASATCEVLFELFSQSDCLMDLYMATCLYTGLATDTGCFKFENTSPAAHRAAAELMECGVPYAIINRMMFDVKSKNRIKIEQELTASMEYFCGDKITFLAVSKELMDKFQIPENEFEGLASLPMQLDGVEVGLSLKQRDADTWKVSMRSAGEANVSQICAQFGGGGHIRAAGCLMKGELADIKKTLVEAVAKAVEALS